MKWIEAIGAPGVGKSFLIERLSAIRKSNAINHKWMTEEEILKSSTSKITLANCKNLYQILLYLYSSQNILSYKKKGVKTVLGKEIFEPKQGIQTSTWFPALEYHRKGLDKSCYSEEIKASIEANYLRLLRRYQFYEAIQPEQAIFIDEGIFQNNFGAFEKLLQSKSLARPALIVYYREKVDLIYDRVLKKELETGKRCLWYNGFNVAGLKTRIREIIERQDENIEKLRNFGIPILHVDAGTVDCDKRLMELLTEINQKL